MGGRGPRESGCVVSSSLPVVFFGICVLSVRVVVHMLVQLMDCFEINDVTDDWEDKQRGSSGRD